jgi:tripeptidyl-peptidase-1
MIKTHFAQLRGFSIPRTLQADKHPHRSDPTSDKYGKHWTAEEVHNAFAPEEETIANIREWLTDFGIHDSRTMHYENKGWIAVDVTVEEAEALLLTEFHEHEHKLTSKVRVGCDKYAPRSAPCDN